MKIDAKAEEVKKLKKDIMRLELDRVVQDNIIAALKAKVEHFRQLLLVSAMAYGPIKVTKMGVVAEARDNNLIIREPFDEDVYVIDWEAKK